MSDSDCVTGVQIDWAGFWDDDIPEKFRTFAQENPHVEQQLVMRARELKRAGHQRAGMKMLFEVLRWSHMRTTDEPFKLNNNYAPYYTRLIHKRYPDLDGFFTMRKSAADSEDLS